MTLKDSQKIFTVALKEKVPQPLDLRIGGGVVGGKARKGDYRKEIADFQAPEKNSKMAVYKLAFGSATCNRKLSYKFNQN